MKLADIVQKLPLQSVVDIDLDREVKGGYCSDLLSDVMAKAAEGSIWVTNQAHQNVAAVAVLTEVAAVIVAGGVEPDKDLADKAKANAVNLFTTDLSSYEIVGRLYELGIKGLSKQ